MRPSQGAPTPTRSPPWPLTNDLQTSPQSNILPSGRMVISATFRVPAHQLSVDSIIPYDPPDTPVTIVPIDVSRRSSWSSLSAAEKQLSRHESQPRRGEGSSLRPRRAASEPRATPSPHGIQLQAQATSIRPLRRDVQTITLPHRPYHTSAGIIQYPRSRPPIPSRSSSLIKKTVRPLRASTTLAGPPLPPVQEHLLPPSASTPGPRPLRHPLRSPLSTVPVPYQHGHKRAASSPVLLTPPSRSPLAERGSYVPPTPFPSEGRFSALIRPNSASGTRSPPWATTSVRKLLGKAVAFLSSLLAFTSLTLAVSTPLHNESAPFALISFGSAIALPSVFPPHFAHPISLFFLVISHTLSGCAPNTTALVAGHVLSGLASAFVVSSSLALSSTLATSPWALHLSAAIEATILPLGLVLGLIVTKGFATHAIYGWQYWSLAIFAVVLLLLSGILFTYSVGRPVESKTRRRRILHASMAATTTVGLALVFGPILAATLISRGWSNVYLPFMLAVGVTLIVFLIPFSQLPPFDALQTVLRRTGIQIVAVTTSSAALAGPLLWYRSLRPPGLTSTLELLAVPAAALIMSKVAILVLLMIALPGPTAKRSRKHMSRHAAHLLCLLGAAMMCAGNVALVFASSKTFWSLLAVWAALAGGGLGIALTAAHAWMLGTEDADRARAGACTLRAAEAVGLGLGVAVAANLDKVDTKAVLWGGVGWSGVGVLLVVCMWCLGTVRSWRGGGEDGEEREGGKQ